MLAYSFYLKRQKIIINNVSNKTPNLELKLCKIYYHKIYHVDLDEHVI